jgi:hypothetical protein
LVKPQSIIISPYLPSSQYIKDVIPSSLSIAKGKKGLIFSGPFLTYEIVIPSNN